jgi:hypothetical protein
MLVVFMAVADVVTAQTTPPEPVGKNAIFETSTGMTIKVDMKAGVFSSPRSNSGHIRDCSDDFQVCLTDGQEFSFAFFKNCNSTVADWGRLMFGPETVALLHGHEWIVFDAAPMYLFHYVRPRGIVGIYIWPRSHGDFRSYFSDPRVRSDPDLRLDKLSEYRIVGNGLAGCVY